jgi:alpha-D-ribose 1-methylphosphonate 5-triphosphate synthase subunit PhnG
MSDTPADPNRTARQRWMSVLARASAAEIDALLGACPPLDDFVALRGPETGLAMVRGRAGGGGGAFNLGEITVTRCTVRDAGGRIGHAYVTGRDHRQARLAARLDAALLDPARAEMLEARVIAKLADAQAARRAADAQRAAATQVQFFTMATMRS